MKCDCSSGLSFKIKERPVCVVHKIGSVERIYEEQYFTHFYSGFYPKRSQRASITTVEPAFNEEEWHASIVLAHFHEGFFPSYSDSFFCLLWQGKGKIAVFGEVYIFANLLVSPWDRSKGFFVCSFEIAAHKKHAHCGCAVPKGLYLCKTSLLLQGWCDLLLLLEWSSFAPSVGNSLW